MYTTIADPYNQRLAAIENSLNRSRSTLAQQQSGQYSTNPTMYGTHYTNSLASVGTVHNRSNGLYPTTSTSTAARRNMTAQLVADVQNLEQQRSILLEETRRRNYASGNYQQQRARQLREATRYEADLRAQQATRRQQEMQMRAHVYNTLTTLPTTTALPPYNTGFPYNNAVSAYQAQQSLYNAQAVAAFELEQQRRALEYERAAQHNRTVQSMRMEADRLENDRMRIEAQRRSVAQAAAARGRSLQSRLADQQARTEASAAAAAAASAERVAAAARRAYEQAATSDMRSLQLSAQLERDRELFHVLTTNTLQGIDVDMYDPMLDDLYMEPFRRNNNGAIYRHPWRPSNRKTTNIIGNGFQQDEMTWRGRKVRIQHEEKEDTMAVVVVGEQKEKGNEMKKEKEKEMEKSTSPSAVEAIANEVVSEVVKEVAKEEMVKEPVVAPTTNTTTITGVNTVEIAEEEEENAPSVLPIKEETTNEKEKKEIADDGAAKSDETKSDSAEAKSDETQNSDEAKSDKAKQEADSAEEKKEEGKDDLPPPPLPNSEEDKEDEETVIVQGNTYIITDEPEMIPIGNADMINNPINHRPIVKDGKEQSKIIIIGSGWHKAMEFAPMLAGLTPDIKADKYDPKSTAGKIVFATLDDVCVSVDLATSLNIRNDPMAIKEKEAEGDKEKMSQVQQEKDERLQSYKNNFKTWIQSLAPGMTNMATLTFIRNVYPMDDQGNIQPTKVKAAWVTGLGVDAALDCGSGKVAVVDGVTGAQKSSNRKWQTNEADPRWVEEDIEKYADMLSEICKEAGREMTTDGDGKVQMTMAYATGNWRKKHMHETVEPFRAALLKRGIDFNLLPGPLEAKYGGISSLKCAAPYDKENVEWIVIELGGGSTQISRFRKK